jgi:hypothetical protein
MSRKKRKKNEVYFFCFLYLWPIFNMLYIRRFEYKIMRPKINGFFRIFLEKSAKITALHIKKI